jgi:phosphoserine aminotransferase
MTQPSSKPKNPCFSSGPTAKRPGWTLEGLSTESLGRSHRAKGPKGRLQKVIDQSKQILGVPDDYLVGIVPASDTGAFEMAMWSLLGSRGVDVLHWESFGSGWKTDIEKHLKLEDVREFKAGYGELPDLAQVDTKTRDVVFTWNGTTSGVCVPSGDWIDDDREGLTLCDATSAAFAMPLPWHKLDVVTWSWQKVMGGEGAHGMLVLSPRAVARLESFNPDRALPKIFRLTKAGKVTLDLFEGATINTPSMLAVEDHLDALAWAEKLGGLDALIARSKANLQVIRDWVTSTPWVDFLATTEATQSSTSICLKIISPSFTELDETAQSAFVKTMTGLLESENAAYDIASYRDAPPGLRIWGGATVEASDLQCLTAWLNWAFEETTASLAS